MYLLDTFDPVLVQEVKILSAKISHGIGNNKMYQVLDLLLQQMQ
jgi:hypothetical protein